MIIGFSSGCLYKTHHRLAPETIKIFADSGSNAIELMYHDASETDSFLALKKEQFESFEYISVHAPGYNKDKHEEYLDLLRAISKQHKEIGFNAIVLHPYLFDDFSFLKELDLPFMVENMDERKISCKNVEDLQKVFEKFDVPMVLDVNHCYANDRSMKLAEEFKIAFGNRIKEIHLSGFDTLHEPLFQTKQENIMSAVYDNALPIIIESGIERVEDLKKELDYIKSYFGNKAKIAA